MPTKTDPKTGAYPTPLLGETAEVAGLRLRQEADVFRAKQRAEKEAVAARAAKAEADALAIAAAEADDEERRQVAIWLNQRGFSQDNTEDLPEGVDREEMLRRLGVIGCPRMVLTLDNGAEGRWHSVNAWYTRIGGLEKQEVERELAAKRAAALERAADAQIEYEARIAQQQKLEA